MAPIGGEVDVEGKGVFEVWERGAVVDVDEEEATVEEAPAELLLSVLSDEEVLELAEADVVITCVTTIDFVGAAGFEEAGADSTVDGAAFAFPVMTT